MSAKMANHFRLGSLLCRIEAEAASGWSKILADVNGTPLFQAGEEAVADLVIRFEERPDLPIRGADELRVEETEDGFLLESDPLNIRLENGPNQNSATLEVKQPSMAEEQLGFHFWLVTNRMLMLMDRMRLHCAAVEVDGLVALFCGRRGSGKSTLSVSLAQAGATILAEDHVILKQEQGEFFVSGCTSRVRVTAKTEEGLLNGRLSSAAVDVGGVPKKDFPAEQFFKSAPYIDRKPDLLFLSRVGERFAVNELSKKNALLGLMAVTGEMLRFSNGRDYESFVDSLSEFVGAVPTYSLELSPDLTQLPLLAEWLKGVR